jgi:hypothetical protein
MSDGQRRHLFNEGLLMKFAQLKRSAVMRPVTTEGRAAAAQPASIYY